MKNMAQSVPFLLIAVFVLMSIILFLVMGRDKALSKTRKRRVPEATLFLLALLSAGCRRPRSSCWPCWAAPWAGSWACRSSATRPSM